MPGQPIATIGSMTVCPLCSGTVPHVGGPVTGPGMPGVTVNGQPVAVMGDICTCVGPPATIVQGSPGVTINGTPVATVGSMTAHGGQVTMGVPGVMIGPAVPTPDVTMPLREIPFPNINILDDLGAAIVGKAKIHQQGKENIEKLKQEATTAIEESEEYSISSTFGLDQLNRLADELSEVTFVTILRQIFGHEIPISAYKQLYRDLSDRKVITIDIEVIKNSIYGHEGAYSNRENIIFLSEKTLKAAIENEEERPKLLAILTEEFGHHIDYLLRNEYTSQGGDARWDEGAELAYSVFDINPFTQDKVNIGNVSSPEFSGMLSIDISGLQQKLKQFVDEQAQKDDGKTDDGNFEFFNAGRLEHGYAHENIDARLADIGFSEDYELPHVFFGNWMRDLSQLITGTTVLLNKSTISELSANPKSKDYLKLYQLTEEAKLPFFKTTMPLKFPRETLVKVVSLLGAYEFIYLKHKDKFKEDDAVTCVNLFNKFYGSITDEMLGCYRPEEHIDNPKGLGREYSSQNKDFFIGCHDNQLKIDCHTGMKLYLKNNFDAAGNKVAHDNYLIDQRPSPYHYIIHKLKSAANLGNSINAEIKKEGLRDLGAALHVLQDYFAHTNFVEVALIKLVNPNVYPWVEKVKKTKGNKTYTIKPSLVKESMLNSEMLDKIRVVDIPEKFIANQNQFYKKAQIIPIVSGVFGMMDTMATLCNKLRHFYEIKAYDYKRPKAGERTFVDLMILALGEGQMIGQNEDAAQKNDTYTGKAVELAKDDSYGKGVLLGAHKYLLQFHDYRAKQIEEGGVAGSIFEGVDRSMYTLGYAIGIPMPVAINGITFAIEAGVKEHETFPREFGTDPTHTQLNKDDPAHPINDLAGKLGVQATKRVGEKIRDIWRGNDIFQNLVKIVDDIMSHPSRTDWMDETVKTWGKAHPDRVELLRESSYIEIAKKLYEQKEKEWEDFKKNIDVPANKTITKYKNEEK